MKSAQFAFLAATVSSLLGCNSEMSETSEVGSVSQAVLEGGCTPGARSECSWVGTCNDEGTECLCDDYEHRKSSERCEFWHEVVPPSEQPGGSTSGTGGSTGGGTGGGSGDGGAILTLQNLPVGDANCPYGGTQFNTPGGEPTYACEGGPGPMGTPGTEGPVGPVGPVGPAGPVGSQGSQGILGAAGAVGPMGSVGPMGPAGTSGVQGPAGSPGADGSEGAVGAQGPDGAEGPPGPGMNFRTYFAKESNIYPLTQEPIAFVQVQGGSYAVQASVDLTLNAFGSTSAVASCSLTSGGAFADRQVLNSTRDVSVRSSVSLMGILVVPDGFVQNIYLRCNGTYVRVDDARLLVLERDPDYVVMP